MASVLSRYESYLKSMENYQSSLCRIDGQFKTLEHVAVEVQKVWDELEVFTSRSISNSMKNRLIAFLRANCAKVGIRTDIWR